MAYPSTPLDESHGKTSSGNKATTAWGDVDDLEILIRKSPLLQKKDSEVLMAMVESNEYEAFKQLINVNGSVTDDEMEILTMFVLGGTPPSTPPVQINSTVNLPTGFRSKTSTYSSEHKHQPPRIPKRTYLLPISAGSASATYLLTCSLK